MKMLCDVPAFQCGLYIATFGGVEEAAAFVDRYRVCPNWPVVASSRDARQVFIVAIELRCQQHGDFSQSRNTLVAHPEYLGAQSVAFRRDDSLLILFPGHAIITGNAEQPPCGAECATCPSYYTPCRGCPATWTAPPLST
jgi:hypothetical protein